MTRHAGEAVSRWDLEPNTNCKQTRNVGNKEYDHGQLEDVAAFDRRDESSDLLSLRETTIRIRFPAMRKLRRRRRFRRPHHDTRPDHATQSPRPHWYESIDELQIVDEFVGGAVVA